MTSGPVIGQERCGPTSTGGSIAGDEPSQDLRVARLTQQLRATRRAVNLRRGLGGRCCGCQL
jgi:hypothetical protein